MKAMKELERAAEAEKAVSTITETDLDLYRNFLKTIN